MNAINFNRLANQAVGFLNEQLIPTFSPLQKKIAVIAIAVFAGIAAWFVYKRCFNPKEENQNAKINAVIEDSKVVKGDQAPATNLPLEHSKKPFTQIETKGSQIQEKSLIGSADLLTVPPQHYEECIEKLGTHMKNVFEKYYVDKWIEEQNKKENSSQPISSGLCFVNLKFEEGKSIKQQFIFKNKDGSPLTKNDCLNNIDLMMKSVNGDFNKDLGSLEKCDWFILFKGGDLFKQIRGDYNSKNEYQEWVSGRSDGTACGGFDDLQNLQEYIKLCVDALGDMGIPNGTAFIQNGEFVPGQYYKDINA